MSWRYSRGSRTWSPSPRLPGCLTMVIPRAWRADERLGLARPSKESRVPFSRGAAGCEVLLLRMSSAVRPAREPRPAAVGSGAGEVVAGVDPD